MASITITLDDDLAERLREKAEQQGGRSISSLIREACDEKLERDNKPAPQPVTEEAAV
jgi:metal-responsive CopG/Arc/MetJ family transcriptional regulator